MSDNTQAPGTFCWNEIGSTDTAVAKKFYTELLGWTTEDKKMPGDMGTYTLLKADGHEVAGLYLLAGEHFEGVPSHWLGYIAVSDVDATAQQAEKLGATMLCPPMDIPDVGRMAVWKDPQGAAIAVFKFAGHKAAPSSVAQGNFCWNELLTDDVEAATEFYTSLFGWTPAKQDMGGTEYTMLMNGDAPAGGLMKKPAEMGEAPPHWMTYITVDDCDAQVKRVTELGGKVYSPPMDIPGIGRFSMIADPTGAVVGIITLTPAES